MKILSNLILTAIVAITLKRCKTEFLLVRVNDMVNTGKFFKNLFFYGKVDDQIYII